MNTTTVAITAIICAALTALAIISEAGKTARERAKLKAGGERQRDGGKDHKRNERHHSS